MYLYQYFYVYLHAMCTQMCTHIHMCTHMCIVLVCVLSTYITCPGSIGREAADVGIVLTEHVLPPGVQSLDGHLASNQLGEQVNVNVPLVEPLHKVRVLGEVLRHLLQLWPATTNKHHGSNEFWHLTL